MRKNTESMLKHALRVPVQDLKLFYVRSSVLVKFLKKQVRKGNMTKDEALDIIQHRDRIRRGEEISHYYNK